MSGADPPGKLSGFLQQAQGRVGTNVRMQQERFRSINNSHTRSHGTNLSRYLCVLFFSSCSSIPPVKPALDDILVNRFGNALRGFEWPRRNEVIRNADTVRSAIAAWHQNLGPASEGRCLSSKEYCSFLDFFLSAARLQRARRRQQVGNAIILLHADMSQMCNPTLQLSWGVEATSSQPSM